MDDQKSLSIAFLTISDQYTTFLFFKFVFSRWPPAAILEVRFAPKTIRFFHYVLSMAMSNMQLIGEYMTQSRFKNLFSIFSVELVDLHTLYDVILQQGNSLQVSNIQILQPIEKAISHMNIHYMYIDLPFILHVSP